MIGPHASGGYKSDNRKWFPEIAHFVDTVRAQFGIDLVDLGTLACTYVDPIARIEYVKLDCYNCYQSSRPVMKKRDGYTLLVCGLCLEPVRVEEPDGTVVHLHREWGAVPWRVRPQSIEERIYGNAPPVTKGRNTAERPT